MWYLLSRLHLRMHTCLIHLFSIYSKTCIRSKKLHHLRIPIERTKLYHIIIILLQNVQYNHPNRFHNAIAQYVHVYWKYWGLLIREIRGILFLFLHSNSQKNLANFVFLNHSLSIYMVPSGELQSRNETYGGS